jgi:hypothetical protein
MLLEVHNAQLVLTDCQNRLIPVIFEHDLLIANAVRLARTSGRLKQPVRGTTQNPGKLGPNLSELQAAIEFAGGGALTGASGRGPGDAKDGGV